jgi:hypothetical protein
VLLPGCPAAPQRAGPAGGRHAQRPPSVARLGRVWGHHRADVTPEFRATAAAWLAEAAAHAQELAQLEAPGAVEQRQADRRAMVAAIDAGLLRRAPVVA